LAVAIAKKFNGEIISADSRQVYKELDAGTGKVRGRWRPKVKRQNPKGKSASQKAKVFIYKKVVHHCIDFVLPRRVYTVADFKECAGDAIRDIARRGKLAILCGGTGFWIDAVAYDTALPLVAPDVELRKKLEGKTVQELSRMLERVDGRRAGAVDKKNPRRLIRAIEIARALGNVPRLKKKKSPHDVLWIGIRREPKELKRRIERRAAAMVRSGRVVKEVRMLLAKRAGRKRIREFGFEYSLALEYSDGGMARDEFALRLARETHRYAKRQMTWWKRNLEIRWISDEDAACRIAAEWLARRNRAG